MTTVGGKDVPLPVHRLVPSRGWGRCQGFTTWRGVAHEACDRPVLGLRCACGLWVSAHRHEFADAKATKAAALQSFYEHLLRTDREDQ